ncbi:hypothetical protein DFH27DRAFT_179436 [Peziza echinospora]|nr:hypothetical protein DFH27DRAFT_179436 [Peziza echinospora]
MRSQTCAVWLSPVASSRVWLMARAGCLAAAADMHPAIPRLPSEPQASSQESGQQVIRSFKLQLLERPALLSANLTTCTHSLQSETAFGHCCPLEQYPLSLKGILHFAQQSNETTRVSTEGEIVSFPVQLACLGSIDFLSFLLIGGLLFCDCTHLIVQRISTALVF